MRAFRFPARDKVDENFQIPPPFVFCPARRIARHSMALGGAFRRARRVSTVDSEEASWNKASLLWTTRTMWAWRCGNCTRAVNPAVAERILACVDKNVRRLRRAASSVARNGAGADMLVSPGNVAGVVSNVVEKALGGLKKAGNALFQDVLDYGCPPRGPGLYLMDGPGHDGEAVTGQVASGANLVPFTTGRGTPAGFPGVPVLKITGNPMLFKSMAANLDFDAGRLFSEGLPLKILGRDLFEALLRTASGEPTKAELRGHEELFCISCFMATHRCCEGCGEA